MEVVPFCGGLGMRLRDDDENLPKPMAAIGYRPILWQVMKYYAYLGHKDFILCLGRRADASEVRFSWREGGRVLFDAIEGIVGKPPPVASPVRQPVPLGEPGLAAGAALFGIDR